VKEREEAHEDELLDDRHKLPRLSLGPIVANEKAERAAQASGVAQQDRVQQRHTRRPQGNGHPCRGAHSGRRRRAAKERAGALDSVVLSQKGDRTTFLSIREGVARRKSTETAAGKRGEEQEGPPEYERKCIDRGAAGELGHGEGGERDAERRKCGEPELTLERSQADAHGLKARQPGEEVQIGNGDDVEQPRICSGEAQGVDGSELRDDLQK
jgi:hypothetical protein